MIPPPRQRSGVLLAGGRSKRFGGVPKGLAALGDRRLADWPLQLLNVICAEVLVAANDPAAAVWFPSHRVVRDAEPGRGALGALETALRGATHDTVVVCAWDMPFVTPAIVIALAEAVDGGAPCCMPMHADGALEPLCAAYDRSCSAVVTQMLTAGERAAHAVMTQLGGTPWPVAQHLDPRDAQRIFSNVNTSDDLREAHRWLSDPHQVPNRENCL